ncbi:MAG TPA: UvrD-helicase domain-containing protein, partial [Victivallales bacterium]|nr:UvrD-helicase domain-containing protein [Victivallales bacterium]
MKGSGKIFEGLNAEQAAAVRSIHGPVLVFAGAGTGKTRVITHRIAHMIDCGIDAGNIAAMTFTNKAANEMRERLASLVRSEESKRVFIGTFHSYCSRLLRREITLLGWTADFTIADDSDQISIIKQAIAELGFKDDLQPSVCMNVISRCKSLMKEPGELKDDGVGRDYANIAEVYEKYNSLLFVQNMLDFDDLLLLTVRIFEKFPDVLDACRRKHSHLLVDEYQDTNSLQFKLIRMLAGDAMNLCVVGDDDQSIYGWRGAEVRNILDFPKYFKGVKSFKLEQNYRSTKTILDAANAVISKNADRHEKNLWSECGDGEP